MSMSKTTNSIPKGVTIDIDASPEDKSTSKSWFGVSNSSPSSETIVDSSSSSKSLIPKGNSGYIRIGVIIVILLFLGVNIFSYLGDFFQNIKDTSAPIIGSILQNLGLVVTETTKDVTQITAEGAKLGVDVAAGTVESGIDVIQGQLDMDQSGSQNKTSTPTTNSNAKQGSLSASLTSALADAEYNSEPLPDDATSSTQRSGPTKSGYCYIGEDRGFRSCISVKDSDVCMSGQIFPSNEICVNPSLRE
jgi:hypothetical protein